MRTDRIRTELKAWKFALDQTGIGEGSGWAGKYYDDSRWREVETCTPWENYEHAMFDYEGRGWYRTVFRPVEKNRRYLLHFEGIGGVARVYVNGAYAGGTESRYLPFELDITDFLWTGGENAVAVLVDNRFRGAEYLTGGKKIEWVLYGGLTHRVWVEETGAVRISHLRADASADRTAAVTVTLSNMEMGRDFEGTVTAQLGGLPECAVTKDVVCPRSGAGYTGSIKSVLHLTAEQAALWSPDSPNLYDLKVTLRDGAGKTVEEWYERIGFRTICTQETKILLNGEDLRIKGANRYDEYAPYGVTPPEDVIRADLLAMKKAGINLIRTHYPQDPIHYALADEIGLMYMIEVPLNWWNPGEGETLADHLTLATEAMDCLDRTFFWHCNHPSWTIWSVGNECAHSAPAAQEMFRMLAKRMRGLDCGRLITYACNKPLRSSEELDFCDILSMNYYCGIKSESVEDFEEQLTAVLEEKLQIAQGLYPNVPHMMSEFGYVCVAGMHNSPNGGRYAEDFGVVFLKTKCEKFLADPQMRGLIIWCWADYRHRRGFVPAPSGMGFQATYGPYGLVTIDRKPKQMLLDAVTEVFDRWK